MANQNPPPTTVVFVRHGQTDWNVAGRWQGQTDIPLNESGRRQAQLVAQRLRAWPIQAVYSSDLGRAAETAAAIAAALDLTPRLDSAWRERHGGLFEGLTRAERELRFPELGARFHRDLGQAPPGGESEAAILGRALARYQELLAQHANETIVVVSHGGILYALLSHLLGFDLAGRRRFTLRGNTGISVVEAGSAGPLISRLNDTAHLE